MDEDRRGDLQPLNFTCSAAGTRSSIWPALAVELPVSTTVSAYGKASCGRASSQKYASYKTRLSDYGTSMSAINAKTRSHSQPNLSPAKFGEIRTTFPSMTG